MKMLREILEPESRRSELVEGCINLINSEVQSKGGISGVAIKTAFALVKAIKPTILAESVDGLLEELIDALQPHYASFQNGGNANLETYFGNHRSQVAESMLGVTDTRATKASNKTLVKAYNKLRPKGKEHVEQAASKVGALIDQFLN